MTYYTFTDGAGSSFTNGGAPGINAAVMNGIRDLLLHAWFDSAITSNSSGVQTSLGQIVNGAIQPNPTSTVLNGSTSGTATLYQPFTGTFKLIAVYLNNFRNGNAGVQNLTIPTGIASLFIAWTSAFAQCSLKTGGSGGSTLTVNVVTTLASGGGSTTGVTTFGSNSWFHGSACDTLVFAGSQGSASTGLILLAGI